LAGTPNISPAGYPDFPKYRSDLPSADVFNELRTATVHTTAARRTLDPDLSLHDIPLYVFQNVFTLLKTKPDLFRCDSTGTTIEACDPFHR
jgi:hypothetical protein